MRNLLGFQIPDQTVPRYLFSSSTWLAFFFFLFFVWVDQFQKTAVSLYPSLYPHPLRYHFGNAFLQEVDSIFHCLNISRIHVLLGPTKCSGNTQSMGQEASSILCVFWKPATTICASLVQPAGGRGAARSRTQLSRLKLSRTTYYAASRHPSRWESLLSTGRAIWESQPAADYRSVREFDFEEKSPLAQPIDP